MKLSKTVAMIALGISGACSVGFAALLGVGCNYTVTIKPPKSIASIEGISEMKIGVGSMNYGKVLEPSNAPDLGLGGGSYNDAVNEAKNKIDTYSKALNDAKKAAESKYPSGTANRDEKIAEAIFMPQMFYDIANGTIIGYNMMISGATLFSISALVFLVVLGLYLIPKFKNKNKVSNN